MVASMIYFYSNLSNYPSLTFCPSNFAEFLWEEIWSAWNCSSQLHNLRRSCLISYLLLAKSSFYVRLVPNKLWDNWLRIRDLMEAWLIKNYNNQMDLIFGLFVFILTWIHCWFWISKNSFCKVSNAKAKFSSYLLSGDSVSNSSGAQ